MKKHFILYSLMVLSALSAMAQGYSVLGSNYGGVTLQFRTSNLAQDVYKFQGDTYSILSMPGYNADGERGTPSLPTMVKLVEVPLGGQIEYHISQAIYDTVDANTLGVEYPVIPQQPSRSKSDNSAFTLVKDDAAYATNAFLGHSVIRVNNIGVMRDRNLAEIYFSPMRYNPVTRQFIICKELTVTVSVTQPDVIATQQMKQRYHSNAFGATAQVVNSLPMPKAVSHTAPLRYLIVAHNMFQGQFDEFVSWKRRQGLIVDVAYTDGNTINDSTIKNYIKQQYTDATASKPAPTYVLLIGDVEQIPAAGESSYSGYTHVSDLTYFTWTEGDNLPDCYYGRFSAQSVAQLTPQIEKTLMYEQYAFPDDSFLGRAALISGVDGGYSGDNAYRFCDPTMDYIAKMYIKGSNGFNNIVYYKNNTDVHPTGVTVTGSCQASATASELLNFYNDGFALVNYSAHGDITEWHSPNFSNSNVNTMTNQNKYGIMIGSCCLTNHFNTGTCFGEALLRKANGGAVAYIGGSNVTYWYEDFTWAVGMRDESSVNNLYNAPYDANNLGAYDRLFHTNGESHDMWNITAGSMIAAGNMAVQSSTSDIKDYYWEIYHLMGDPSLMPWLGQAQPMTVNTSTPLLSGAATYTMNVPAYAYVAFTHGDSLIDAAFADATGNVTLFFNPLTGIDSVELAVTAQNYKPYLQKLPVITPNGPYLVISRLTCSTYLAGDTTHFAVTLNNVGRETASNIAVRLTVDGNQMLLLDEGYIDISQSIESNDTLTLTDCASAYIWPSMTNGTVGEVNATVYWNIGTEDADSSSFVLHPVFKAPMLDATYSNFAGIQPGGNMQMIITNTNHGGTSLNNATATLVSSSEYVTVSAVDTILNNLFVDRSIHTIYNITVSPDAINGITVPLAYRVTNGQYSYSTTFMLGIGHGPVEDFEGGTLTNIAWQQDATYPWTIDTVRKHNGTYSARSFNFHGGGDESSSTMTITWTASGKDSISYWRYISSEYRYDKFLFYIDDALMDEASGLDDWTRRAFPVSEGTHTFTFRYSKDYSTYSNDDAVWIDDIQLPYSSNHRFEFDTACQGANQLTIHGSNIDITGLAAGNYSRQVTIDSITYHIALTLLPLPVPQISATETNIQLGESVVLSASGAERYVWDMGQTVPSVRLWPSATRSYGVTGYNGVCSSSAHIVVTVEGTGITSADADQLAVFPNPATAAITVRSNTPIRNLRIYDAQGRLVVSQETLSREAFINLSNMPRGIYILQATMDQGTTVSRKIVKQ